MRTATRTVPIPGIRTVASAEQNAAALNLGPLPPAAMTEIAQMLGTSTPLTTWMCLARSSAKRARMPPASFGP